MTDIFAHPLFANIDQKAFETELYAHNFSGAAVDIMGESAYLNAREAGIQLALSKKHKINAIHLYSGCLEGFSCYQGPLPLDIGFNTTRAQIREKLGLPAMSGEHGGVGIMTLEHAFDRYESDAYYIRFQFVAGEVGVRLITLGQA